ncbi:MAG: acetyltransferase [Burkholderiales bacterium]|jgi:sugar O-acyltransferase (sialic acid O-acetyltransferase NeuD family)|nr:acetyltransferase [Burkholderiales bacterium]
MQPQATAAVVIYGNGQVAELAMARLLADSPHRVVGFTVDGALIRQAVLHGLPVVPFEEAERHFPPEQVRMFVAVGPTQCNRIRAERFEQARRRGYGFVGYVSSRAQVAADVQIGENVSIGEGTIVHPFVRIGDDVHIGTASVISHHCLLGDHSFLAVGCLLAGNVKVGPRSFLGARATVRDHVAIGEASVIGTGVTVLRNTAPSSVLVAPEPVLLPVDSASVRL